MGAVAGHFLLTLQTSYAISGGLLRQKCWFYHGKCWFYRHIECRPLPIGEPTLYAL
jgi:hypothetical protein